MTIGLDRLRAVQQDDVLLVGGAKSGSISTGYLIEVGSQIRLVCGKSVLELNASGEINISGSSFMLYASGKEDIDTGGRLDLNSGGAGEIDANGIRRQGSHRCSCKSIFPGKPKA